MTRYRKEGRVVHFEHGELITIAESGEAHEHGRTFLARSLDPPGWTEGPSAEQILAVAAAIETRVTAPLRIERLVVSEGIARHEYVSRTWRENTRRIHIAIASPDGNRLLVDRADFDVDAASLILPRLAACEGERAAPPLLRLAPQVTAALLPALLSPGIAGASVWQRGGGIDGRGKEVRAKRLTAPPWPNWFRPSYRVRPVRAPFHLELRAERWDADRELPRATGILAPVRSATIRALIEEGDATYAATFTVAGIEAAGPPAVWFPYGAGAWGCEAVVRSGSDGG